MVTHVLVHGGWQGGWSYQQLARLLRKAGQNVYVATLTGLGERSHLSHLPINLDTHIADVVNLIMYEGLNDVVLTGHSYGGMVVTGVADRLADRVQTLVYLDALVPEDGDTLLSALPDYQTLFLERAAAGGGRLIAPNPASDYDSRPEFWPLLDARNTPHPLACFTQKLSLTGAHRQVRRKVFIYVKGGILDGAYERFQSDDRSSVHEIAGSGHSVMLDQPEQVCRILLDQT